MASGFVASTVGISAIVFGVHAVRRARWGSAASRAFGRGGSFLGGVGTVLMLYGLIAFALTGVGVTLPALSLASAGTDVGDPAPPAFPVTTAPSASAPSVPGTTAADPAAVAPASGTAAQEREALTQAAGTLALTMRQRFGTGPFPAEIVRAEAPGRLMTSDGAVLAPLPEGTRVLYSVSADRTAWSVTLVGRANGSVVTYSSTIGTVQSG